ncbi:MAG: porin family protein [Blastocatellia bacterium]|nr:porin family protein [Blastocatellia bacterium]
MKKLITVVTLILLFSLPARAQQQTEYGTANHVTFGYTTQTGDFGPNGFEAGLDYRLTKYLALVGEGSFLWKKNRVNNVRTNLIPGGGVTDIRVSNNAQNFLFGPRVFFPRAFREPKVVPFAHLLFGVSRQSTGINLALQEGEIGSSVDTNWSWTLGGGVDYWFNKKWAVRGKIDLLRTHFLDEGQSKARFTVAVGYNFDFRR